MKSRNSNPSGNAGNDQAEAGIQINPPPQEPLYLYQWYLLTATDYVFWSAGPEQPDPGDSRPGHTVLFSDIPSSSTSFIVVGPNTDIDNITIYARLGGGGEDPASTNLPFKAVNNPPRGGSVGAMLLDGSPLQIDTNVHLIRATCADASGAPLNGEVNWRVIFRGPGEANLLTGKTPILADGTTTNGIVFKGGLGVAYVLAQIPGVDGGAQLEVPARANAAPPSITIALDASQHQLTATYPGAGNETDVLWEAFPCDQVQFGKRTTQTMNESTQNTITYTGDGPFTAYISASSFNPKTGARDYGTQQFELVPGGQQADEITVESNSATPPLWTAYPLTARHTGDTAKVTQVEWAVDPLKDTTHRFEFDPPCSKMTGDGGNGTTGTTNITVRGPSGNVPVQVYAYPYPANPAVKSVPATLTFTDQGNMPSGATLSVESLDDDPLLDGVYHLFRASYITADGKRATTPGWTGNFTWSPPNDGRFTWATTDPTPADDNGVAFNALKSNSPGGVTVTAKAQGPEDSFVGSGSLLVTFADEVTQPAGQGSMTIEPLQGTFDVGTPQTFSVTYLGGDNHKVDDGTSVAFYASPQDQLTFSNPSNGGSGNIAKTKDGIATIDVTATDAISTAVIGATGLFNPEAGTTDHTDPNAEVSFQAGEQVGITVASEGSTPPLYTGYQLTGTNNDTSVDVPALIWSTSPDPDYIFKFDSNPSPMTGGQSTTTNITGYGPNTNPTTVTVYARSADPDKWVEPIGQKTLNFQPVSRPPFGGVINVVSLEGNPLAEGEWHLLEATYMEFNGDPIPHYNSLTWTAVADPPTATVELAKASGQTEMNGVMSNAVRVSGGAAKVKVTVSATNSQDSSDLQLIFQPAPLQEPAAQGSMTIAPTGPSLPLAEPFPLVVTYYDGSGSWMPDDTVVTWHGFPSDRLTFDSVTTTISGGQGQSTNNVTASDGTDISMAVISTTSFNKKTGSNDHSDPDAVVSFTHKQPTQGVVGIMIDKASCLMKWPVNPAISTQVVRCQAKVLGVTSAQTVSLPTTPAAAGVQMWATNLEELDAPDGTTYQMQTDASGVATFLVGSSNTTYLGVNVQWTTATSASAQLAIVGGSGGLPSPTLPPNLLQGGILPIPSNVPTFPVTIPTSRGLSPGDPVALVLNNRVVWEGNAADPTVTANVAYAALNRTGLNTLIYVTTQQQQSAPATGAPFATDGGTPQTDPYPTVHRGLPMPNVVTSTQGAVVASDIVDQGLKVYIQPYGALEGDDIWVYGYLSGTYALPLLADPASNIIAVNYKVPSGSPLLSGKQVLVPLPQWAVAGYTNGQLKIDYKVVNGADGTRWSAIAPSTTSTYSLNTKAF